jgi:hypothetical protein
MNKPLREACSFFAWSIRHEKKIKMEVVQAVEKSGGSSHCIYILQKEIRKQYQIGYTLNLNEFIKVGGKGKEQKLVYTRLFNNLIDALSYKLFLEHISTASLKRIIQKQNPDPEDVKHNKSYG